MFADIDIWRTARLIMKLRDEPEFYAAQRADELLAAGDPEGNRVWRRIGMAIRNLSVRDPVCPTCKGARLSARPTKTGRGPEKAVTRALAGAGPSRRALNAIRVNRRPSSGTANRLGRVPSRFEYPATMAPTEIPVHDLRANADSVSRVGAACQRALARRNQAVPRRQLMSPFVPLAVGYGRGSSSP